MVQQGCLIVAYLGLSAILCWMLNIKNKLPEGIITFNLYYSGKSCYVMARYCLEATFWDFYAPGFLLMQQSLENLIKSCLKQENIDWKQKDGRYGNEGHQFKRLIELGKDIKFFKEKIINRHDFLSLLKELEDGYNPQRYGESGCFIESQEKMMDLFDEIVFILVTGFTTLVEPRNNEKLERLMALPVPDYMEKTFKRKLKQSFIFTNVLPLDFK